MDDSTTIITIRAAPAVALLQRFLDSRGIQLQACADALGVAHPSVIAWLGGRARPRTHLRAALESWTSGEVQITDWDLPEEIAAADVPPYAPPPTGTHSR